MDFKLTAQYSPTGDQPSAISQLTNGVEQNQAAQTLLGVTGSGKTFTMANVIQNTQRPALVIAHNKTLAAQLYQEFRDFFPQNAVSYFVSYYDYYQPEAYIPSSDTYIEKDSSINEEIDKLRLATTTNLLTRKDVIVVASVSCIYNLGSPVEYGKFQLRLTIGEIIKRETLLLQLANLQYEQTGAELMRGTYRIRGDSIQIWPAYEDQALHIDTLTNTITNIFWIDPISGSTHAEKNQQQAQQHHPQKFILYPAKHYVVDPVSQEEALKKIHQDALTQEKHFTQLGKMVEAYRIRQKVEYDLEMIREFGFVSGIENYSIYFDGRAQGQAPYTLLDYFAENHRLFKTGPHITFVDESHITLPQIKGMHRGDHARKQNLIEYGFRLPSALDNRPLRQDEFLDRSPVLISVSATPSELEIKLSNQETVEQLIRPTGLIDPNVELRPVENQIEDLVMEILLRKQRQERVLVTTLTKKMAEALTEYLNDQEKIAKLVQSYLKRTSAPATGEAVFWNQELLPITQMKIGKIEAEYFRHLRDTTDWQTLAQNYQFPSVAYLHSDIDTLERSDILDDLRSGKYDVVVGINLLREGLDLPEVTLVAILDADKEGFLRSRTSLIQTMGRAARHDSGQVILYADKLTGSMKDAITETLRRRQIQTEYNVQHSITPQTIIKPIRQKMITNRTKSNKRSRSRRAEEKAKPEGVVISLSKKETINLGTLNPADLTPADISRLVPKLKRRMNQAAKDMDYELAALIRDSINLLTEH